MYVCNTIQLELLATIKLFLGIPLESLYSSIRDVGALLDVKEMKMKRLLYLEYSKAQVKG